MTYAYVMRTVDRTARPKPARNYLGDTLQSLDQGGFFAAAKLHLVDSSPSPWLRDSFNGHANVGGALYECHFADRVYTNNENALRALMIGLGTGADWIVHLEDDIAVCRDLPGSIDRWLTEYASEHYVLYTFHTPYRQVQDRHAQGLATWPYPVQAFYGNQCWAIRRADAEDLATYLTTRIPTWTTGQGFDLIIKEWANHAGESFFLASCPSFVQHIGRESALHLGRFHENGSFPGTDWSYQP